MSNRKKEEQKQTLSQPFKFADADLLMKNAEALCAAQGSIAVSSLLHWKHRTHAPAYALGDITNAARLVDLARTSTPSALLGIGTEPMPNWICMSRHSESAQIYADLWNNGHKFHVIMARQHGQQNTILSTQREYADLYGSMFDMFVTRSTPNYVPILPAYNYTNATGAASLVRRFMLGEGQEMSLMKSKVVKEGEFKEALYTASRYFITYLQKFTPNPATRDFSNQWINGAIERGHIPIPLVTLVMKKEDIPLVKASWLNDEPIEASKFELWVDKSLDDEDSKHPFRTQYVRAIRNPLRNLGINVVVKDNLYKECFKSMEVPKFKTMKEEKEFVETKLEKILNEERRRYGVVIAPAPTAPPEELFASMEGDMVARG